MPSRTPKKGVVSEDDVKECEGKKCSNAVKAVDFQVFGCGKEREGKERVGSEQDQLISERQTARFAGVNKAGAD